MAAAGSAASEPPTLTYADLLEKFGPQPDDPLAIPGYMARLMLEAATRTLRGDGNYALNQDLRAMAGAINRMIPLERLRQAEEEIKEFKLRRKPGRPRGPAVEILGPGSSSGSGKIVRG